MNATQMLGYIARTRDDGVPYRAVLNKCRNWGVPFDRAKQIAEDSSEEAYQRSLVQETRVEGYFQHELHFRRWVTTVAINDAIDLLRREAKVGPAMIEELLEDPKSTANGSTVIGLCLESLSEVERQILWSTYSRLTLDEIVEELKKNVPDALRVDQAETPQKASPSRNALRLRVMRLRDAAKLQLEECLKANGHDPFGRKAGRASRLGVSR
jgi:DNA-directed RNA polymerase specialized sigma24 family protein